MGSSEVAKGSAAGSSDLALVFLCVSVYLL